MVTINFVGDVALFKNYEVMRQDPFNAIELPESDFNVANFEFPVAPDGAKKKFYDVDDNYRVSESFSRQLSIDKFNLYSLGNNHIADYGIEGISKTIEIISSSGSSFFGVGTSGFNSYSCDISGIGFLFIACVKRGRWSRRAGEVGPDDYDIESLIEYIDLHKGAHDHVIVFPHWGTELVDAPDPCDVINARAMIDAGASCVIGHHPHVSQGCEEYRGGLIAYSLGSFIYLPDFEKGNIDKSKDRDVSICLSVEFNKCGVINYIPYKFVLNKHLFVPVCHGDFRQENNYERLCGVIGDRRYYSQRVRSVLLKRELYSFFTRLRENPMSTFFHYLNYISLKHVKKILGLS